MSVSFSASILSELAERINREMGLHFPPGRMPDLARSLAGAAREFGFSDGETCARWLLETAFTQTQVEILAHHLTVGETYFFRDTRAFEALEQHVLPELVRSRREVSRRLRIWSAACCTGEEAYSLAICVRRAIPDLAAWDVKILGTDINSHFLQRARDGVFGAWSFRETPSEFRRDYFTQIGDRKWEIRPEIRRMVRFAHFNLATGEALPPSLSTEGMDLIFCRNALIYFTPEKAAVAVAKLNAQLNDIGWLVLGPNEIPYAAASRLISVRFEGAIFNRKDSGERFEDRVPSALRDPEEGIVALSHPAPSVEPPMPAVDRTIFPFEPPARNGSEETPPANVFPLESHLEAVAERPGQDSLARGLANEGRLPEALAACDALITADKMNATFHYLQASILQGLGRWSEAADSLRRCVYLAPDFVLAHFALATLARSQGNRADSERQMANALAVARKLTPETVLIEGEGLTAGRLIEIAKTLGAVRVVA